MVEVVVEMVGDRSGVANIDSAAVVDGGVAVMML